MTTTLTERQLVDAVHSYLTLVAQNETMRAVSEAYDHEVGEEVADHWEDVHDESLAERPDDYEALVGLGRYVVKLAREIVRSTTPRSTEPETPRPPAPRHPEDADSPMPEGHLTECGVAVGLSCTCHDDSPDWTSS